MSIEDLETEDVLGVPAGAAVDVWCYASNHSIDVYTMSYDEADAADRAVRVRVYRGADPSGLGSMVRWNSRPESSPSVTTSTRQPMISNCS